MLPVAAFEHLMVGFWMVKLTWIVFDGLVLCMGKWLWNKKWLLGDVVFLGGWKTLIFWWCVDVLMVRWPCKKIGKMCFYKQKVVWLFVGVCVCWVLYFFLLKIWICISMLRICIYIKYIYIHEHAQHRLELLAMASSWPFYAQSFFEQNICKSKWAGSNDIWIPHLSDIIVTSICKNGPIWKEKDHPSKPLILRR